MQIRKYVRRADELRAARVLHLLVRAGSRAVPVVGKVEKLECCGWERQEGTVSNILRATTTSTRNTDVKPKERTPGRNHILRKHLALLQKRLHGVGR